MPTTVTYPMALRVDQMFVDHHYQRDCDLGRARSMAAAWDRRLAGVIEVSDRGEAHPAHLARYAIVDGQHRWAAAGFNDPAAVLVANVHEGLTLPEEAVLFDRLNRQRKQPSAWDHWRARRAAGDPTVLAIEQVARDHGLVVANQVKEGNVWCLSTLEKIAGSSGGIELLAAVFTVATAAWGTSRTAYEAPVLHGLAMVLYEFAETVDADKLVAVLQDTPPTRIKLAANSSRDAGTPGSVSKLVAVALAHVYNRNWPRGGRGPLHWHPRWTGVLPRTATRAKTMPALTPRARDARAATPASTPASTPVAPRSAPPRASGGGNMPGNIPARTSSGTVPHLTEVGDPSRAKPRGVPDDVPPVAGYSDEQADAVAAMEGSSVRDISAALRIPERTVRRIHADLGVTP